VEISKHEQHPNKHVRDDPRRETVTPDRDGTVPEERGQRPRVGSGDRGEMDKRRQGTMDPVRGGLAEEVCGQDDFGSPEVVPHPEQDPREDEEVVQDEVARDAAGCVHQRCIPGKEMPDVGELREQEEDPFDDICQRRLWRANMYPADSLPRCN